MFSPCIYFSSKIVIFKFGGKGSDRVLIKKLSQHIWSPQMSGHYHFTKPSHLCVCVYIIRYYKRCVKEIRYPPINKVSNERALIYTAQQGPCKHTMHHVRFEVFMAVAMKNAVFWDIMPCGSCKNRYIRGTHCLHYQGDKIWRARNVSNNQ
jgi:hypothetical protein